MTKKVERVWCDTSSSCASVTLVFPALPSRNRSVRRAADPAAAAIGRELLGGGYIQADETPVPVQMHDRRGKNHQAYLWQYGRPGGSAVFDFRTGRGREGPKKFLGSYEGILQTDAYSAYDRTGGAELVHAACWARARRAR